MTFRPTFNEVKRTHTLLSKIEHYDASYLDYSRALETKNEKSNKIKESHDTEKKVTKTNKSKAKNAKHEDKIEEIESVNVKEKEESSSSDEEENFLENEIQGPEVNTTNDDFIQSLSSSHLKIFNDIYTACLTNNASKLEQLLSNSSENESINFENILNKRVNKENGFTLLHLVSQKGNSECIFHLLSHGANPSLPDLTKKCRLPYFLSLNKSTKDQYRRFMNDFPDKYNYALAQITSPLSADKFNEKLEKEREKKRNQRKLKKQREALQKSKEKQQEAELNERKRFLEMSDHQKRLLMEKNFVDTTPLTDAEKIRLNRCKMLDSKPASNNTASACNETLKVTNRCFSCGIDMAKIVPFEYLNFKFCSTKCLKTHRTQHEQSQKKK
jgi:hypothetical protein